MMYCSSLVEACRSRTSAGIARFRIVLSRLMIPSEQHSTARAHQRRSCAVFSSIVTRLASCETLPFRNGGVSRCRWAPPQRRLPLLDRCGHAPADVPLRAEGADEGLVGHRQEE